MKNYLQALIFLIPIISFSQDELEGRYYKPDLSGDTYEYLDFDKDGNFEYAKGGHLGEAQPSKGKYELSDQLLILNFNNSQSKKIGYHQTEIWRNNKDSISVKIKVMDYDKNPLEHVFISGMNNSKRKRTNNRGVAELKFYKENSAQNLIITWVGFEHYDLEIDKNYNYNIKVYLTPNLQQIPIRDQIDTLRIKEFEKVYFRTEKNIIWEKWE
ncbi:hypothetical protein LB465_08425 [Salegentibacter sp. LM13S]|uniref:hypothetical protein n=1 Tax=Salegentibacter lacus TaxID=2873599 RepID=UPI001CCA6F42|nr:hypothetical protein [Salegentibacter lacus]MBZ9630802.1 hypothetical protein [Salegentibacter lacus]